MRLRRPGAFFTHMGSGSSVNPLYLNYIYAMNRILLTSDLTLTTAEHAGKLNILVPDTDWNVSYPPTNTSWALELFHGGTAYEITLLDNDDNPLVPPRTLVAGTSVLVFFDGTELYTL